jgi:hypothetical protein
MDDDLVLRKFRRKKVVTVQFLANLLECSVITTRRRFKKWNVFTSINKNGKYYTLPDIPRFDHHGLWQYKSILFSKHGTLKETMITLIQHSEKGMKSAEMKTILRLPTHSSHLSHLRTSPHIVRENDHGSYIYFSADPSVLSTQKQRLEEYRRDTLTFPTDAEALVLLVEFIKNPMVQSEELSGILSKKGVHLDPRIIVNFLSHHNLLKKTADTER